jgi:hypothetical protein
VGPSLNMGSFYFNKDDIFVGKRKGRKKNVASN